MGNNKKIVLINSNVLKEKTNNDQKVIFINFKTNKPSTEKKFKILKFKKESKVFPKIQNNNNWKKKYIQYSNTKINSDCAKKNYIKPDNQLATNVVNSTEKKYTIKMAKIKLQEHFSGYHAIGYSKLNIPIPKTPHNKNISFAKQSFNISKSEPLIPNISEKLNYHLSSTNELNKILYGIDGIESSKTFELNLFNNLFESSDSFGSLLIGRNNS